MKHEANIEKTGLSRSTAGGFTLVDLLGVAFIIIVLAAIAILSVQGTFTAAQKAAIAREEMELNRAWQHYISQGGPEISGVEPGLAALSSTLEIAGLVQGPWIVNSAIPRQMPVGTQYYQLTFIGKEWRYRPQAEIIPIETGTPAPTPATPTPTATPDLDEYEVQVASATGGSFSKGIGIYQVQEGSSFFIAALPDVNFQFTSWVLNPSVSGVSLTNPNLSFQPSRDVVVSALFTAVTPTPTPSPTATPSKYQVTVNLPLDTFYVGREAISASLSGSYSLQTVEDGLVVYSVTTGSTHTLSLTAFYDWTISGISVEPVGAVTSSGASSVTFRVDQPVNINVSGIPPAYLTAKVDAGVNGSSPNTSASGVLSHSSGTLTLDPAPDGLSYFPAEMMRYKNGTSVKFTATPAAGYRFKGFQGHTTADNSLTITLTARATNIVALFERIP